MLGTLIALLIVLLGVLGVGVVVPSLFWVSVLSLGGLLLAGAVAVSVVTSRWADDDEDDARPRPARTTGAAPQLRLVAPPAAAPIRSGHGGAGERRAA